MKTVKPLDIVKRTPGNNCGECSHPTCLAFAAAVIRGGEDPGKCPYLNTDGLGLDQEEHSAGLDSLQEQRDLALIQHLKQKISVIDFASVAEDLGVAWDKERPGSLFFSYLGQDVVLSKTGILINGREPLDPRDSILLYNYVASGGGRRPSGSWVGMESLPNSISKVRTLAVYCEHRLAKRFGDFAPSVLGGLGNKLGGRPGPDGGNATLGIVIPVLPMVPQYLLFWAEEPEDGFAARVKVLFDRYVLDYLDLESLVFSAERLAERLEGLLTE